MGTQLDCAKRIFPSSTRRLKAADSRRIQRVRRDGLASAGRIETELGQIGEARRHRPEQRQQRGAKDAGERGRDGGCG